MWFVFRNLIKNLFLGYIATKASDKSAALKVFATVLDFDEAEKAKVGLSGANAAAGWFSGLRSPTKDEVIDKTFIITEFKKCIHEN